MDKGTILRIEKISPADGHGLRTVVFFKGCPLRCAWCSTPESHNRQPQLFYKQANCQVCGRCVEICPQSALTINRDKRLVIRDASKCVSCFKCASVCLNHAMGVYGKTMTVNAVMQEIRKEEMFYFYSDGGVTLSGGDILYQADFACQLLKACREECINTTAELDLYGPYENVAKVLEYLNSYYVDIKLIDDEQHRNWTGVSNVSILDNIRRASEEFPEKPLYVRTPLIPGVNDSLENINATVALCKELKNCKALEFLPYHRLGQATYEYIGRTYQLSYLPSMSFEEAYARVGHLKKLQLPFAVLIKGKVLGEEG